MTRRERLENTFRFKPVDRPPHFEQIFELTEEAFGLTYPTEEELSSAVGARSDELFDRTAEIYARTIEEFKWDAVLVWRPAMRNSAQYEFIPYLKKRLGPDVAVGSYIWGSSICIDSITDYMQFSIDLREDRRKLHQWARDMLFAGMEHAKKLIDAGCDIIDVANDYAFNNGTFFRPEDFAEFVTPYMKKLFDFIKGQNVRTILHSDGNLMSVMDQILQIGPDALHSIDPMAGMDIAEVKKMTYRKIALIGNVKCSALQDGPDEEIIASAKYCIDNAGPGSGYVFSSSNTIFKGLPLRNYRAMVDYFHERFNAN